MEITPGQEWTKDYVRSLESRRDFRDIVLSGYLGGQRGTEGSKRYII